MKTLLSSPMFLLAATATTQDADGAIFDVAAALINEHGDLLATWHTLTLPPVWNPMDVRTQAAMTRSGVAARAIIDSPPPGHVKMALAGWMNWIGGGIGNINAAPPMASWTPGAAALFLRAGMNMSGLVDYSRVCADYARSLGHIPADGTAWTLPAACNRYGIPHFLPGRAIGDVLTAWLVVRSLALTGRQAGTEPLGILA